MINRFNELRDSQFFNLFQGQLEANAELVPSPIIYDKNMIHSTHFGGVNEKNQIQSRSLKKKTQNFEISFEAGFVDEHIEALRKRTKNFMEQILRNQNLRGLGFENSELFNQEMGKGPLCLQKLSILSPIEKSKFQKDLEHEDQLDQFFHALENQFPKQIVQQLVYIAFLVWEKYVQVRKAAMTEHEILEISDKFSQDIGNQKLGRVKFLNMYEAKQIHLTSADKIKEAFEEFVKVYCTTVFLIIEGFFENPYSGNYYDKRDRSQSPLDWDSDFFEPVSQLCMGSSTKKIKKQ